MKIVCSRNELQKAMQIIQPIISSKVTLPVLSNFLFEAHGKDEIKIFATNLESSVEFYIQGTIKKEGSVTIPAKKFSDIIKELPDSDIEISVEEAFDINIKAQKSKFKITGIDSQYFPALPVSNKDNIVSIKSDILSSLFEKTIFCVSYDIQKYVLNGVCLILTKHEIRCVSTDGKRLSCVKSYINLMENQTGKVIIPTKSIHDILKIISLNNNCDVKINLDNTFVSFEIGNINFKTKLIDGVFPDYEKIIPKNKVSVANINVDDMFIAVKQMSVLTNNSSVLDNLFAIKFVFEKNKMFLSVNNANIGTGETEISVNYKNDDFSISFNPDYIKDVLQSIDDKEIDFMYSGQKQPIVIKPKNRNEYIHIIMPLI